MKLIVRDPLTAILRIDHGEDVLEEIRRYCDDEEIDAATFTAIGAASKVTLSWYDLTRKVYEDKVIDGQWEIVSLTGNVAQKDEKSFVHAHGVFSDQSMSPQAGHVKALRVGPTCEVALTIIEGSMEREHDERTGLYLLIAPTEERS
jgi:uncharacterized protein